MSGIIETGLRSVDLLVPLAVGSDELVCGDPRSGVRILGTEIALRLASLSVDPFHVVIYLDSGLAEVDKVVAELQDAALFLKSVHVVEAVSSPLLQRHREERQGRKRDAVFAVSSNTRFVHGFRQAIHFERSDRSAEVPLNSFTVCEETIPGDFGARLVCSRAVAVEAIYPAIDTRKSLSTASASSAIGQHRRKTAEQVRMAINEVLENLYEGAIDDENWFFNTDPGGRAAVQLLCFISQPYFIAEPYTGQKGAFVPVNEAVSNFEAILAGRLAHLVPRNFRFRNSLPS